MSSQSKPAYAIWATLTVIVALLGLIYQSGLNGPFVFDDAPHITQNQQLHIQHLSIHDLEQAWNSSLAPRPWHRPLSQLTFGINHALSGLSPFAFKFTNLLIHLINGLLIFVLSRRLMAVYWQVGNSERRVLLFAAFTAAIWLLHPLQVSTVLYAVQRMAQLSTLFILLSLWLYVAGREKQANGQSGFVAIIASLLLAGLGVLAKENTVLLPAYLLVLELTLLRTLKPVRHDSELKLVWLFGIALPLIGGLLFALTHPGYFVYDARPFTLEERGLTELRVLWFYLQMIVLPDITQMGLHHDDFVLSHSLLEPANTLIALMAWLLTLIAALLFSRRYPIAAFAILFFLAAHALESSVLPLELVFEHRNYLALLGPAMALAALFTLPLGNRYLLPTLGLVVCLALAAASWLRVQDWRDQVRFTFAEVLHHPDSKRANFEAAKLYMTLLPNPASREMAYSNARQHFSHILQLDPNNPDALFGLIVLNLHVAQAPKSEWLSQLSEELRTGDVGPTRMTVSQFAFLVRWIRSGQYSLSPEAMHSLFDAALDNPRLPRLARASILAARRAYASDVLGDLPAALEYAKASVALWPQRWHYRKRLAQIHMRLLSFDDARDVLKQALRLNLNQDQRTQANQLLAEIAHKKAIEGVQQ